MAAVIFIISKSENSLIKIKWSDHVIRLTIWIPDIFDCKTYIFEGFRTNIWKLNIWQPDMFGLINYQTFHGASWHIGMLAALYAADPGSILAENNVLFSRNLNLDLSGRIRKRYIFTIQLNGCGYKTLKWVRGSSPHWVRPTSKSKRRGHPHMNREDGKKWVVKLSL